MPSPNGTTGIGEARAAVAFALEVPKSDIVGYVVLGVTPGGDYLMTSNACCYLAMAEHLAAALSEVMGGVHGMMPCKQSN